MLVCCGSGRHALKALGWGVERRAPQPVICALPTLPSVCSLEPGRLTAWALAWLSRASSPLLVSTLSGRVSTFTSHLQASQVPQISICSVSAFSWASFHSSKLHFGSGGVFYVHSVSRFFGLYHSFSSGNRHLSGRHILEGKIMKSISCEIKGGSVQFSSVAQSCPTLCDLMNCSTPGLCVHHRLPEFTQTHVHWVSDSIQPSHPLSSSSPSALNLSQHQVFSNESALRIRWPKYWSFSFNISPYNEHPGLISFRMDWLDLLAVQGTLKSLLQYHSSKADILRCSAFFLVQLSHPYMTTGKTIALTRQTFLGKVMSLLLNMLSRLIINFFPRSKCLLISWLQSPSAVILEPRKIKYDTVSTVSPSIGHDLSFWMLIDL